MSHPLVSIIIPVYNGQNYLREAIDSALAQTYPHIEVIVVNDGSSDAGQTEAIALSYGSRIRYISQVNGGVASALNAGIKAMNGDYFSWLSHDDLYVPNKLAVQMSFLKELGDPEVVLYSDYICVDENNNDVYEVRMDHALLSMKPLYAVFLGALHGCTLLVPCHAFRDVGLFNLLPTTQDYDMWSRMIRYYRFVHMPNILVRSRLHPKQTSRNLAATEEANDLWIRLMSDLTATEIASLEQSECLFFKKMVRVLGQTPYKRAYRYARSRAGALTVLERMEPWRWRAAIKRGLGRLGLLPWARGIKFALKNGCSLDSWRFGLRIISIENKQAGRDSALVQAVEGVLTKLENIRRL